MSTECCFAAYEPRERPPFHPDLPCHRHLDDEEPCRMATGANNNDNMAADETTRALDYIREMCLDRPCPNCKSEVVDEPQDDLRQCRACGHLWGFDDTQNLEEFIREFGRMEPCVVCGNDGLDDFEVVQNDGRQQLICRKCQNVQGTERVAQDWNVEDHEVVQPDQEGYGNLEPDLPDPNQRGARVLACPFCPEMTHDFFEKQFDGDELVRAVCPGCSYVVFFKEQFGAIDDRRALGNGEQFGAIDDRRALGNGEQFGAIDDRRALGNGEQFGAIDDRRALGNGEQFGAIDDRRALGNGVIRAEEDYREAQGNGVRRAQEDGAQDRRVPEDGRQRRADKRRERERQQEEAGGKKKLHLFPTVKRAMKYLCVKPIDLAQHVLQECADSIIENDDNLGPRLSTMAARQGPIMAEQLGWTIGTAVGNIMFKTPAGAAFTGNVGSVVGRGFCNLVLETMHNRPR